MLTQVKYLEVRDSMTFIPVIAFVLGAHLYEDPYSPDSVASSISAESIRFLTARAGYGLASYEQNKYIFVIRLQDCLCQYAPKKWGGRTMSTAHEYIRENFEILEDGEVIDVEYILGETPEPKVSEAKDV
jgi:hypothetical protein